jgi:hypothetical protein
MADVRASSDYGRIAAMFGFITVGLFVLSIIVTFVGGAPPALDASAREIVKYYSDNEGLAKLGGIIGFLALGTVAVFFLGVYSALRDRATAATSAWPRLSLTAFIVSGAFVGVQGAAALAIALGVKDDFGGTPAIAGALFDLYNALAAVVAVVLAVFLAATGVALARAGGYPRWWSTLLYVGALFSLVSFLAPFTEIDALAYLGLIAFIIFTIWIAAASMALQRRGPDTPRAPAM